MKKRTLTAFLTAMIMLSMTVLTSAAAAYSEYKISAIDLTLNVSDELNVLTRSVSESHPALEILETDAVTLRNTYSYNNIYLNAFPDDLTYEILVTSTEINNTEAVNFSDMDNSQFDEYCKTLEDAYASNENEELLELSIYENDTTKYVCTYTHSTLENVSVYAKRYYTVMNGFNYNFIIQTDDMEITPAIEEEFLSIINSAVYAPLKGSITESGLFMDMFETFVGFGLTVLILGTIIFLLNRKPKK